MFPSLPARMSLAERLDTSSLWLGSPTCQRTLHAASQSGAASSCPKEDRVKYRAILKGVKRLVRKNGKVILRTHQAVFRGLLPRGWIPTNRTGVGYVRPIQHDYAVDFPPRQAKSRVL